MAINRRALIGLAMVAANDMEDGYESKDALEGLRNVDPEYDWTPELLQAELEDGYRQMGPARPPVRGLGLGPWDRVLKEEYERHVRLQAERFPFLFGPR